MFLRLRDLVSLCFRLCPTHTRWRTHTHINIYLYIISKSKNLLLSHNLVSQQNFFRLQSLASKYLQKAKHMPDNLYPNYITGLNFYDLQIKRHKVQLFTFNYGVSKNVMIALYLLHTVLFLTDYYR